MEPTPMKKENSKTFNPQQHLVILGSIADYLERHGFKRVRSLLKSEPEIENGGWKARAPNLEEMFGNYLEKLTSVEAVTNRSKKQDVAALMIKESNQSDAISQSVADNSSIKLYTKAPNDGTIILGSVFSYLERHAYHKIVKKLFEFKPEIENEKTHAPKLEDIFGNYLEKLTSVEAVTNRSKKQDVAALMIKESNQSDAISQSVVDNSSIKPNKAPSDGTVSEQQTDESDLKQDRKRKRKTKSIPQAIDSKPGHVKLESHSQVDGKPKDKKKKKQSSGSLVETTEPFKVAPEPISEIPLAQKKNKSTERRGKQEISDSDEALTGRGVEVTHQYKVNANDGSTEATDMEVSCSFEDVDHVKFDGFNNLYYLNQCQSPQEAQSMAYELRLLRFKFKIFPNIRKHSDVYIAVEERGVSLRRFLNSLASQSGFFFGPTLLKYREILIDLVEACRFLMDTRIKCILTLDSVFVKTSGADDLQVTLTRFASRGADAAVDANSEWSEFAAFVESINNECKYPFNSEEKRRRHKSSSPQPCMDDFLSCLRQQNDQWNLDDICKMPLFWHSTERVGFFCRVVDSCKGATDIIDDSAITIPKNWRMLSEVGDQRLKMLLKGHSTVDYSNNPAWAYMSTFRNNMDHFGYSSNLSNDWPKSREDVLRRMETVFPNLMPMLVRFVKSNRREHLLPKEEERLKNLSK